MFRKAQLLHSFLWRTYSTHLFDAKFKGVSKFAFLSVEAQYLAPQQEYKRMIISYIPIS